MEGLFKQRWATKSQPVRRGHALASTSRASTGTRPRHIAFLGTLRVPANPPRTHQPVYYGITLVIQPVTHINICNMVYITCIQISWRVLGQGSKPNPRFWRGLTGTWGRPSKRFRKTRQKRPPSHRFLVYN